MQCDVLHNSSCNHIFIHQATSARRQRRDICDLRVKLHLPTCLPHMVEASHCPLLLLNVKLGISIFVAFYGLTWLPFQEQTLYPLNHRSVQSIGRRLISIRDFILICQVYSTKRQRSYLAVFGSSCHLSTTHGRDFTLSRCS